MQNLEHAGIRQLFRWLNREVYGNLDGDSEYADRVDEAPPDAETLARNEEMLKHFGNGIGTPPAVQTPTNTAATTTLTPRISALDPIPSESIINARPTLVSSPSIISRAHENDRGTSTTPNVEQPPAMLTGNNVSASTISFCLDRI